MTFTLRFASAPLLDLMNIIMDRCYINPGLAIALCGLLTQIIILA